MYLKKKFLTVVHSFAAPYYQNYRRPSLKPNRKKAYQITRPLTTMPQ